LDRYCNNSGLDWLNQLRPDFPDIASIAIILMRLSNYLNGFTLYFQERFAWQVSGSQKSGGKAKDLRASDYMLLQFLTVKEHKD
jgi:hypothetical protein